MLDERPREVEQRGAMTSREHREAREMRARAPEDAVSVELEVPFHDLDPLFVAWHGWYYKYFEIARTALFRAHKIDAVDMIPLNLGFYVVGTRARHIKPLRYSDRFRVAAWFTEHESRVGVAYEAMSVLVERILGPRVPVKGASVPRTETPTS
jgi:acyl-CoA thioester hydrolase